MRLRLQRATGELLVAVKRRGEDSVLDGLRQAGCLKARFPRPIDAGLVRCDNAEHLGRRRGRRSVAYRDSAWVLARGRRSRRRRRSGFTGRCRAARRRWCGPRWQIGPDAAAEWLPQETILFDRCALDRRLVVDMAAGAWFLGVEMLVFGRTAMGERVVTARLRDLIRVRRGGDLLLHDAIRLDGDVDRVTATNRDRPAARARWRRWCMWRRTPRRGWTRCARRWTAVADFGASAWNGMLIARILAPDGASARRERDGGAGGVARRAAAAARVAVLMRGPDA